MPSKKVQSSRAEISVAENERFKEQIIKEIRALKLNDTFSIGQQSLGIVSKKICQQDVIHRASLSLDELRKQLKDIQTEECSDDVQKQLQQNSFSPREKYNQPATDSMNYGWFDAMLTKMNEESGYDPERKWFHGKKATDITSIPFN